jgi:signal transduction histidine kinase
MTMRLLPSVLVPRHVRVRLALMFGALFIASGAVLLAITYLLVSRVPNRVLIADLRHGEPDRRFLGSGQGNKLNPFAQTLRNRLIAQHQDELHHLLVQSGLALAIMAVISIAIGWLVAGRIVRPLRTMSATIQQISARNLHERLGAKGPHDEMKDLSDTVDGLLGRLEAALDTNKRFVANAAHELRTPLTLEHALLEETLTDRTATLESFRLTSERLLAISKQQGRLLEALLTLASSERGLERSEALDLSAIVEQALRAARSEIDQRGLLVDTEIAPAWITGDSALVERLVANLLNNATGYNIPGGRMKVATGVNAGRCVVSVANTGRPIRAEQVDRLFEPFQRLDRTAEQEGHHGLGLSIVRAIANAHGALIAAHARPDGGLFVEVAFPQAAAQVIRYEVGARSE